MLAFQDCLSGGLRALHLIIHGGQPNVCTENPRDVFCRGSSPPIASRSVAKLPRSIAQFLAAEKITRDRYCVHLLIRDGPIYIFCVLGSGGSEKEKKKRQETKTKKTTISRRCKKMKVSQEMKVSALMFKVVV